MNGFLSFRGQDPLRICKIENPALGNAHLRKILYEILGSILTVFLPLEPQLKIHVLGIKITI